MRIAILGTEPIGTSLSGPLVQAGHDVVLAPSDAAGLMPVDVVVVAVDGPQAEQAIASAGAQRGRDSFVVAIASGAAGGGRAARPASRVTLGELSHEASTRVVRLARVFQEAGVTAEVSLDIDAALGRLR
jgi:ketopantoate reductase